MKLQNIIFVIMLIPFLSFKCYAQLDLKIHLLSQNKSTITLKLTSTNRSSNDTILFYVPEESMLCMSLLQINFVNIQNGDNHEYSPCTTIYDIDRILLDKENSFLLLPNDSDSVNMELKLKDVSPYLKKGRYKVIVSLAYEYRNLEHQLDSELDYPIFRGAVKSNEIEIKNNLNYP